MDPLANELSRCKALGAEAAARYACKAIWAENRRAFLRRRHRTRTAQSSYFPRHQMCRQYQRPSRPSAINAAVRRQHAKHGSQGALNRWAARASSIGSWRSSPATSIPALDCSQRCRVPRVHPGRDRHHARRPVLGARIDEDVIARLISKTLYVGVFAFLIGNFNTSRESSSTRLPASV